MTPSTETIIEQRLGVTRSQIAEYCQRWHIIEFALFGSVLRDDFRSDSDIDVLVTFSPTFQRGLSEAIQMQDELQDLFQREVDLISKAAIERSRNQRRRQRILSSAEVVYVA